MSALPGSSALDSFFNSGQDLRLCPSIQVSSCTKRMRLMHTRVVCNVKLLLEDGDKVRVKTDKVVTASRHKICF